jgi:glutathione S-transferase
MIKLYQFAPAFDLPNASPFCMKVEVWLRLAGLPFEIVPPALNHMSKAPKGKLPYIDDDGVIVADSSAIVAHLTGRYGVTLDQWLSAEQVAVALAFQRLAEEHLYWAVLYTRWVEPQGWEQTKLAFFGGMPAVLGRIVPPLARRAMNKSLHGHGMGRHSPEEIHALGQRDIQALSTFLGEKPYFMGEKPCTLDATMYAFLANLVSPKVPPSPLSMGARELPNLVAYCERLKQHCYGNQAPT